MNFVSDGDNATITEEERIEEEELNTAEHDNNPTFAAARARALARREVVDVACGGGFTVCVTKSGHVYSWGVWAHGRLGRKKCWGCNKL